MDNKLNFKALTKGFKFCSNEIFTVFEIIVLFNLNEREELICTNC